MKLSELLDQTQLNGNSQSPVQAQPQELPPNANVKFLQPEMTVGGRKVINVEDWKTFEEMLNQMKHRLGMEEAGIKAATADMGGRVGLALEGTDNIEEVKKVLFPAYAQGETDPNKIMASFDAPVAFASNLPNVTLPSWTFPNVSTPKTMPDIKFLKSDDELVRKANEVADRMRKSISARVLIKTGVASRTEEVAEEKETFNPNIWKRPENIWNRLNELQGFYNTFVNIVDPNQTMRNRASGSDRKSQLKAKYGITT